MIEQQIKVYVEFEYTDAIEDIEQFVDNLLKITDAAPGVQDSSGFYGVPAFFPFVEAIMENDLEKAKSLEADLKTAIVAGGGVVRTGDE